MPGAPARMGEVMDDVFRRIRAAEAMPYGEARIEMMTRLLADVDENEWTEVEAYTLICVVESMFFAGEISHALVPFSRLRRLWDEHPERFDDDDQRLFFSALNWIVGGVIDDPGIPTETIVPLLADLDHLAAVAGEHEQTAAYEQMRWARRSEAGSDEIERRLLAWQTAREDENECPWCQLVRASLVRLDERRFADILQLASDPGPEPTRCWSDPVDLYSVIALSQLETGDAEGAVRTYRRIEATMPRAKAPVVLARARRVELLGRGGAADLAIAGLEAEEQVMVRAVSKAQRMDALAALAAATHALRAEHGDRPVRFGAVPATTVAELDDWLRAEALTLADAFDARVGTTSARARILEHLDAPPPPTPLDLSVSLVQPDWEPDAAAAGAGSAPGGNPTATGADSGTDTTGVGADPSPQGAPPLSAWEAALAHANAAADPQERAGWLSRVVETAREAGALAAAGFAAAELAVTLDGLRDVRGADAAFREAAPLLDAGGVDPALVVPVLVAWAPTAIATGGGDAASQALASTRDRLRLQTFDSVSDDRLRERMEQARDRAAAAADDTRARLLGSGVEPAARPEASALATSAATTFARVGDWRDAADAYWLAGRLQLEDGDRIGAAVSLRAAVDEAIKGAHPELGAIGAEALDVLNDLGDESGAAAVRAAVSR